MPRRIFYITGVKLNTGRNECRIRTNEGLLKKKNDAFNAGNFLTG
jgi:hypothetical protein